MNLVEVKAHAVHWATPLVKPLAAIIGGAGAADALQLQLPVNIWVEAVQLVVAVVVLRTIIFFEFMVHERRERKLYDGVVKTGDSFDRIWEGIERRLKAVEKWRAEASETLEDHGAQLASHARQIRELQSHPVLRRPTVPGSQTPVEQ